MVIINSTFRNTCTFLQIADLIMGDTKKRRKAKDQEQQEVVAQEENREEMDCSEAGVDRLKKDVDQWIEGLKGEIDDADGEEGEGTVEAIQVQPVLSQPPGYVSFVEHCVFRPISCSFDFESVFILLYLFRVFPFIREI